MKRAFGSKNRATMFAEYFGSEGELAAQDAWRHVYKLLLWIDRTTGLAHCYESDKSQPGRHWYGRSLAFHAWLSDQLAVKPSDLASHLDWLFRRAIEEFARGVAAQKANRARSATEQRAPYDEKAMPQPGEDPELVTIIKASLGAHLSSQPSASQWRLLTEEISAHFTQENKRRNLVGEAFEDLIAELVRRVAAGPDIHASTRVPLQNIGGFSAPTAKDKEKKVDVVITRATAPKRVLATAKWSIRADREEQFASDYEAYVRLENLGEVFEYVLVTNEFDPARLLAACERLSGGHPLFARVVHVNPAGVLAAYGSAPEASAAKVVEYINSKRLTSLGEWLASLKGSAQ